MDVNDLMLRLMNGRLREIFSERDDRPSREEISQNFDAALERVLSDLPMEEIEFFERELDAASVGAKRLRIKGAKVRRSSLKKLGAALRGLDNLTAYSELLNKRMVGYLQGWMDPADRSQMPPLLGRKSQLFGGPMMKIILFLSMHARSSTLSAEISHLIKSGYTEAAQARVRTLYELTIYLLVLSTHENASQYELAGRYYVSYLGEIRAQERFMKNLQDGYKKERDRDISMAKRKWGSELFRPYGWALPVLPHVGGPIRFSDLERVVAMDKHRHIYLEMNHAIHAGSANLVHRTNFDNPMLHAIGPELDTYYASRVIKVTARSLSFCTGEANRIVSSLTGNPGAALYTAPLAHLENAVHASLDD